MLFALLTASFKSEIKNQIKITMERQNNFSGIVPLCGDTDTTCHGDGSGGGEDGSENLDEDSSSSSVVYVGSQLDDFRLQWKQELAQKTSPDKVNTLDKSTNTESTSQTVQESDEEKARKFYNKGIFAEEAGLFYEAITFYKKAVQLVPDIELKMREPSVRPRERNISECSQDEVESLYEEEEEDEPDLIIRFQRYRQKNGGLYCLPRHERKGAHVSDLPLELLMYILKWVVSADLDLKSLEQFSMVCRGFYLCSRDEEIWKLACLRVWGIKCVKNFYNQSWRHLYLEKHHLRFNGCYISRTTYIRHGETSYIDQTYRPWYLVEYYRYLRFFPEGIVLMLTTADNPYIALSKLNSRTPRFASVMVGHYRLHENTVNAILKPPTSAVDNKMFRRRRRNQNDELSDSGQLTYHLELEVQHVKRRPNFKLVWKHYAVHTKYKSGHEAVANFELVPNNFSPFWYSIVKSYSSMSEKPLM